MIEISNLLDHLGLQNLLTVTTPSFLTLLSQHFTQKLYNL